ncbi:MAG: PLDc N-terminal domain-containing protein [Chitinophagaceae bacterium]
MDPSNIGTFGYIAIAICFLIWVYALVDVLRSRFAGRNEKLIWVLVVLLFSTLGAIVYLFIGRKHKVNYA